MCQLTFKLVNVKQKYLGTLVFVQALQLFLNTKMQKKFTSISAAVIQESPIQFTDSQPSETKTSYPD